LVVLVVFVSLILILSTVDTPLNIKVYNVTTGSMEPSIPVGSLVVTRESGNYTEGDVITFKEKIMGEETFTHRVLEVREDERGNKLYRTKGDANESADINLTPENLVLGEVILTIPLAGKLLAFTKTPVGFVSLIAFPATIIVYSEIGSIKNEVEGIMKDRKKRKSSKENKEKE
jgi:signal peptidase